MLAWSVSCIPRESRHPTGSTGSPAIPVEDYVPGWTTVDVNAQRTA